MPGTIGVSVSTAPDQGGSTTVGGAPATVSLAKPGEQAVVSFPGTAGQDVFTQISLSGSTGNCGDVDVQDTVSGVVSYGDCLNSAPVYIDDTTLPDTAAYEVLVTPSGGYTGTVTVTVTAVPAPLTATAAYGGAGVKMTTAAPGQDAVITYTGVPANTDVEANITASTYGPGDEPSGYLNDPDDDPLVYCDDALGDACETTTTSAGSYTLDLDHFGPYTGATTAQLIADPGGDALPSGSRLPRRTATRSPGTAPASGPAARVPVVHLPKRPRTGSAMAGPWRPGRRSGAPLWSWTPGPAS